MKKSTIVVIVLAAVSCLSMMYAFVQNAEAQKHRSIAVFSMERAVKAMEESESCRIAAQKQVEIATARAVALESAMRDALTATETERQRAEKALKQKKK